MRPVPSSARVAVVSRRESDALSAISGAVSRDVYEVVGDTIWTPMGFDAQPVSQDEVGKFAGLILVDLVKRGLP